MTARFGWVRGVLAAAAVFGLVAAAVSDPLPAIVVVPALAGGLLAAGALFVIHRRRALAHLEDATDAPTSKRLEMFNTSSVTPAGVGGLGLGAMALWVALQYPEGRMLMVLGLLGGIGIASTMILMGRQKTAARITRLRDR